MHTTNASCESHKFCVAVGASSFRNYVVHEGNWKVHSAKMMEQMRSEARVCHFGFQFLRWLFIPIVESVTSSMDTQVVPQPVRPLRGLVQSLQTELLDPSDHAPK